MNSAILTIPCYNEAARLPRFLPSLLERISDSELSVTVEVVDDGSSEIEHAGIVTLVEALRAQFIFLLPLRTLKPNRGKGGAVHASWRAANGYDWLAFVDADGSISPEETCRCLVQCLRTPLKRSFFASRVRMLGKRVERDTRRHLMGRVFATLVGTLIDPRVYDSQCGLKAIPATHYRLVSPLLEETRFAFDVELLAALLHLGLPVEEIPIDWVDVAGSKVNPVRDTALMLKALFRIRKRRNDWPVTTDTQNEGNL